MRQERWRVSNGIGVSAERVPWLAVPVVSHAGELLVGSLGDFESLAVPSPCLHQRPERTPSHTTLYSTRTKPPKRKPALHFLNISERDDRLLSVP